MRVFGVESGEFREYVPTPFSVEHEEAVLEDWLEGNPDGIVEDGKLLIIGRQVPTNLGGFIDLLAVDYHGNIVVIELKRDRTPRDTLAQALEYASFAESLSMEQMEELLRQYLQDPSVRLMDYHRQCFRLDPKEGVAFNKEQRIVLVGQQISPEVRQTSLFLRSKGVRVTCVEFTFFRANDGTTLLSQDIVVGRECPRQGPVTSGSRSAITHDEFLASLDENGRHVFSRVLRFAEEQNMLAKPTPEGFSLNVNLPGGDRVAICYAYRGRQSLYTGWRGSGGMCYKTAVPPEAFDSLATKAMDTGLFVRSGKQDVQCVVDRLFSEEEIASLISVIQSIAQAVKDFGPRPQTSPGA